MRLFTVIAVLLTSHIMTAQRVLTEPFIGFGLAKYKEGMRIPYHSYPENSIGYYANGGINFLINTNNEWLSPIIGLEFSRSTIGFTMHRIPGPHERQLDRYWKRQGEIKSIQNTYYGKLGLELHNKANSLFIQTNAIIQYLQTPKCEGNIVHTTSYYSSDTTYIDISTTELNQSYRFENASWFALNLELRLGTRINIGNQNKLGYAIRYLFFSKRIGNYVKRDQFGFILSYCF